jgi:hypothetical protein
MDTRLVLMLFSCSRLVFMLLLLPYLHYPHLLFTSSVHISRIRAPYVRCQASRELISSGRQTLTMISSLYSSRQS